MSASDHLPLPQDDPKTASQDADAVAPASSRGGSPSKADMSEQVSSVVKRVREGDRLAIAKAISSIENGSEEGRQIAAQLYKYTGNSYTIGITGAPGAGKSTLTDKLIEEIRKRGQTVGVIAVDPTSPFTGGAILGDRVRMQQHVTDSGVFIRSMATRGHLGGLALAAPQAMRVLDAAGKDFVIVETVGVGQVEVEIVEEVDTTVVVLNPGWGDSIQAAKAGLLEIADIFVVNKADRPDADRAVRDLMNMLELAPAGDWKKPVIKTVATEGKGVTELLEAILDHRSYLERTGALEAERTRRVISELKRTVREVLGRKAEDICYSQAFESVAKRVLAKELDPQGGALELLGEAGV
jgi:LAO/AO transport system kinase